MKLEPGYRIQVEGQLGWIENNCRGDDIFFLKDTSFQIGKKVEVAGFFLKEGREEGRREREKP